MKLQLLLETLKVKELTEKLESIVDESRNQATQTPQGPEYFNLAKKKFWNYLKAKCQIEMRVNIHTTDRTDAAAHTTPLKPLNVYLSTSLVDWCTDFILSSNTNNNRVGIERLVSVLVHEITHLKQFAKLTNVSNADDYYNINKPHHERHMEIEAHCNQIWSYVKRILVSKDGDFDFNISVIHNILVDFLKRYGVDFTTLPSSVKKQYYKKLYKVFTTDGGLMPNHDVKKGDIVMIYSDPIEETPDFLDRYIVTDVDGYKIEVQRVKLDTDTSTYKPIGFTKKLVNRMFVAPHTMSPTDMFYDWSKFSI